MIAKGFLVTKSYEKYDMFINNYWLYYRELEDELLATRRYVDFEQGNFTTYSVEYLKLYQAICSEIDVIGKAMASEIDFNYKPVDKQNNIYKWWKIIQNDVRFPIYNNEKFDWEYISLIDAKVDFFMRLPIKPWSNFETEIRVDKRGVPRTELVPGRQIPAWWSDYNKVKHQRTYKITQSSQLSNYTKANLGNVVEAISALYILEMSYMHMVATDSDKEAFADYSRLFCKIVFTTKEDIDRMFDFGEEV